MSAGRRALLSTFFAAFLLAHAWEILAQTEHWPLSNYAMYAEVTRDRFTRKKIVGVLADGSEIPLQVDRAFSPFDNTRLSFAMKRIHDTRTPAEFQQAMTELLARYEMLRVLNRHRGPPIVGLRAYEERHRIVSGASNRDRAPRERLYEATAAPRSAP